MKGSEIEVVSPPAGKRRKGVAAEAPAFPPPAGEETEAAAGTCPADNQASSSIPRPLRIDIVTIFPEMFDGVLNTGMLRLGRERGLLDIRPVNLRDYTTDRHNQTDDTPCGGGAGMVMMPEPLFRCVEALSEGAEKPRVVLTTPAGEPYTQATAQELACEDHLIILCGRYEGVDERVREHLVTDEISIGDYILTGGEIAAMVIVDSVARLVPGVLGRQESAEEESFSDGLLEYPHYTKPAVFREWAVPDILLSGHHEKIRLWRRKESIRRTLERRPDLLEGREWSKEDRKLLKEIEEEP
jgi:tRNA (guanine37-N1)-methyltransferase